MTRSAIAISSAALLLATSCGNRQQVDVTRSATGTIPGAAGSPPLPSGAFGSFGILLDRGALDQSGISVSDVDSAKVIALRLAVTDGTSFETWLDAISFFVETPSLPRVLVAQKAGVRGLPSGTHTIDLDVPGVDVKPYILAPGATVRIEAAGSQPSASTTIDATATLRVTASMNGL